MAGQDITPEQARDWFNRQKDADKYIISQSYEQTGSSTDFFVWLSVVYRDHIIRGPGTRKKPSVPPVNLLDESSPFAPPSAPQQGKPRQQPGVPPVVGAAFNPSVPPPAPTGQGQTPGPLQTPPARPAQPSQQQQGLQQPPLVRVAPPSALPPAQEIAEALAKQQARIENLREARLPKNVSSQARLDLEEAKRTRELERDLHIETGKQRGRQVGKIFGMEEVGGGIGGAVAMMRGGPAGMAMAGFKIAGQAVQSLAGMQDVLVNLSKSKLSGNPLEEARARGEALGKVPVIGSLLEGLNSLSSGIWKQHYAVREATQRLHGENMDFAKFSASMSQVQAQRQIQEIELEQKRGERRAPSAKMLSDVEMMAAKENAVWEDKRAREQAVDAARANIYSIARQRARDQGLPEVMDPSYWKDLDEQLKKIKKFEETGQWEGTSPVNYEDTLPGYMDGAKKRHDDWKEINRPKRFK